jgi:hypothetical protein
VSDIDDSAPDQRALRAESSRGETTRGATNTDAHMSGTRDALTTRCVMRNTSERDFPQHETRFAVPIKTSMRYDGGSRT